MAIKYMYIQITDRRTSNNVHKYYFYFIAKGFLLYFMTVAME